MAKTMIEVSRFSFSIGRKEILKDVSFAVQEGEYLSITGPNGAGKSTLLKRLVRIHHGGDGAIRLAGKPLDDYSQKTLAQQISYVPQADGRVAPFTVHEFVMMGRYPYLSPFSPAGTDDEKAVRQALAMTETSSFAQRSLHTLSGGERQKVFIAAALAQETSVARRTDHFSGSQTRSGYPTVVGTHQPRTWDDDSLGDP